MGTKERCAVRADARAIAAIVLLSLVATRHAVADESPRHGWWFDLGYGLVTLASGRDAPMRGTGTLLDGVIGGRLNERWLMGLELGGTTTSASDNSDTDLGGTLTHTMLAVRYVPQVDHGWVWGLGTGPVFYSNMAVEIFTGIYNTGNGWAGNAAAGYDWKLGSGSKHLELVLSLEQGRMSLSSPLSGHFNYTAVALSAHIASF